MGAGDRTAATDIDSVSEPPSVGATAVIVLLSSDSSGTGD